MHQELATLGQALHRMRDVGLRALQTLIEAAEEVLGSKISSLEPAGTSDGCWVHRAATVLAGLEVDPEHPL